MKLNCFCYDLKAAASKIVKSKIANNSASCSSKNAVALEARIYDEMIACLEAEGGYLCSPEEREKLRELMWPDGKTLNRKIVARTAPHIAEMAGLDIPTDTRFLMVLGLKAGSEDRFSGEKISPILTVWKWDDFSEMVEQMKEMHRFSGEGHSASIHSERPCTSFSAIAAAKTSSTSWSSFLLTASLFIGLRRIEYAD